MKNEIIHSEAFKKFFGDWEKNPESASKVVDENGEPLILWHGSLEDFNVFSITKDIGFHFGTKEQAEHRIKIGYSRESNQKHWDFLNGKEKGFIKGYYLSIKNPLKMGDAGNWDAIDFMIDKNAVSVIGKENIKSYNDRLSKKEPIEYNKENLKIKQEFKDIFIANGYDGIVYKNDFEGDKMEISWIAFHPEQIKLADGSNVTFDSSKKDMRYETGGEIKGIIYGKNEIRKLLPLELNYEELYLFFDNYYFVELKMPFGKKRKIYAKISKRPDFNKNAFVFEVIDIYGDVKNEVIIANIKDIYFIEPIAQSKMDGQFERISKISKLNYINKYREGGEVKSFRECGTCVEVIDLNKEHFDLQKIKNRRFIYVRDKNVLMLGGNNVSVRTHAQEYFDVFKTNDGFDDTSRGWVGTGDNYPNGIIHFSPAYTAEWLKQWPYLYFRMFQTLEIFSNNGANENTVVRGIGSAKKELKMSDFIEAEYSEGGEITNPNKVFSASSRFRPYETIFFDNPIIGKNGSKLISYTWTYEWTEDWSVTKGEPIEKRISDWTQAEQSADTGRNIVHQFTVEMPSGETRTVSSESVLILLGYADRKELKGFPSLVNAVKTLAKQKLKLAVLEAQEKFYNELKDKFEKAEKPKIIEIEEPIKFVRETRTENEDTVFSMGDVWRRQDNRFDYNTKKHIKSTIPSRETIEQLTYSWIFKRIEENGGVFPSELYDLRKRIERQERKVKQISSKEVMENGGIINSPDKIKVYHGTIEQILEADKNELIWFTDNKKVADQYRKRSILKNEINWDKLGDPDDDITESESAIDVVAEEQGINLNLGKVHEGYLILDNPLDLTDYGANIDDIQELWDDLHNRGLLTEPWSDIDEEFQQEIKDDFQGKALWKLLEEESVYEAARKKGYDAVIINDVGIDGKPHNGYAIWGISKFHQGFEKGGVMEGVLLAPNGKPSNLTPEQYKLVRTHEFKLWFGDWENSPETSSKVVDENGEPLVLYHGTRHDFFEFRKENLIWCTSDLSYINERQAVENSLMGNRLISLFANAKNILDLTSLGYKGISGSDFNNALQQKGIKQLPYADDDFRRPYAYLNNYSRAKFLLNEGIDCIHMAVTNNENGYAFFHPNQVKLATRENVTFDGSNPDIRLEEGGMIEHNDIIYSDNFKRWFGDFQTAYKVAGLDFSNKAWDGVSKMVDDNGIPLICYHGTNSEFTVFDIDAGQANDNGYYGRGFYFTFGNGKYSRSEAGYYGSKIMEFYIRTVNPFDIEKLSVYKGKTIRNMGTETMIFLYNIAKMFPEIAEKVFIKRVKWNEFGEGDVDSLPISILVELFEKYEKLVKITDITNGSDGRKYKTGYVKVETGEYKLEDGTIKKWESSEDLGRWQYEINEKELEVELISAAIQKYDGISSDYHPEGYMTRYPIITEAIKKRGHDAIMQTKYGDEIVVFEPMQIKLADGTNTAFDGYNTDIRYKNGGAVDAINLSFQERLDAAMLNLKRSSRTANAIIDVSASEGKSKIFSKDDPEYIAKLAIDNFHSTLWHLYNKRNQTFSDRILIAQIVNDTNRKINKGIVAEGVLFRTEDSPKFPYTKVGQLHNAFMQFASEFYERLDNSDAIETAAWVHWRINMTDHFYADGCGKTAEIISYWVLMRHNIPFYKYPEKREEWFAHASKTLKDVSNIESYYQSDYKEWVKYFRTLFSSESKSAVKNKIKVYRGTGDRVNATYGGVSDDGMGVFYTTNKNMAEWFAGMKEYNPDSSKYENTGKDGKIIEKEVLLNNPYIIDSSHKDYDLDREYDSFHIYMQEIKNAGGVDKYKSKIIAGGYDGIILKGNTTNYYGDGQYDIVIEIKNEEQMSNEKCNLTWTGNGIENFEKFKLFILDTNFEYQEEGDNGVCFYVSDREDAMMTMCDVQKQVVKRHHLSGEWHFDGEKMDPDTIIDRKIDLQCSPKKDYMYKVPTFQEYFSPDKNYASPQDRAFAEYQLLQETRPKFTTEELAIVNNNIEATQQGTFGIRAWKTKDGVVEIKHISNGYGYSQYASIPDYYEFYYNGKLIGRTDSYKTAIGYTIDYINGNNIPKEENKESKIFLPAHSQSNLDIKLAIDGDFQDAIASGKMISDDAKKIIESAHIEVPKDIISVKKEVAEKSDSIIGKNTDLLGDPKKLWMLTRDEFLKSKSLSKTDKIAGNWFLISDIEQHDFKGKEKKPLIQLKPLYNDFKTWGKYGVDFYNGIRFKHNSEYYKWLKTNGSDMFDDLVYSAINEHNLGIQHNIEKFSSAISEGRMTNSDAIKIIESAGVEVPIGAGIEIHKEIEKEVEPEKVEHKPGMSEKELSRVKIQDKIRSFEILEKYGKEGVDKEKIKKKIAAFRIALKYMPKDDKMEDGGVIEDGEKKDRYIKWHELVNMSKSELEKFMKSKDGMDAGLSKEEASELGIHNGHESAKWILKMKDTDPSKWTPEMWDWAKRQISFISRMRGNKGGLYDEKGNKTRKHTSLLIWGHNPEKF